MIQHNMEYPPYGPADLAAKMDHVEDRLTAVFERLFDLYEVPLFAVALLPCFFTHAPPSEPRQSTPA